MNRKLYFIVALMSVTSLMVYYMQRGDETVIKPPIKSFFTDIPGYTLTSIQTMEEGALAMLDLDDHVFSNYEKDGKKVNLYIGYYYTANKTYAAHSPLICYPSQGWKIGQGPLRGSLEIPPYTINYEEITTNYGEQKELVLYWYQTRFFTNNQIYQNKVDMGINKLRHDHQQHAFVRVAVPYRDNSYEQAKQTALDFTTAFFPEFIKYILE